MQYCGSGIRCFFNPHGSGFGTGIQTKFFPDLGSRIQPMSLVTILWVKRVKFFVYWLKSFSVPVPQQGLNVCKLLQEKNTKFNLGKNGRIFTDVRYLSTKSRVLARSSLSETMSDLAALTGCPSIPCSSLYCILVQLYHWSSLNIIKHIICSINITYVYYIYKNQNR